jgi:hypothetical protein
MRRKVSIGNGKTMDRVMTKAPQGRKGPVQTPPTGVKVRLQARSAHRRERYPFGGTAEGADRHDVILQACPGGFTLQHPVPIEEAPQNLCLARRCECDHL